MRRLFACLAVVAASVVSGLFVAPVGATTSNWTQMTGPPQISGQTIQWASDSCVSSTFCMAVGPTRSTTPPINVEPSELWNGSSWSYVSVPVPELPGSLTSVSCTTTTFCMAVGYSPSGTFADKWNGSSWSLVSVAAAPDGYGLLGAVDCLSASDCEAVGADGESLTFAEQWNGLSWTIVPTQTDSTSSRDMLAAVSCSGPSNCWAVGTQDDFPLAEEFNGSAWTIVSIPQTGDPSGLLSVSCPSSSFCEAVGSDYPASSGGISVPLIDTWNGTEWTQIPSPVAPVSGQNISLSSVACPSETSCIAVGADQAGSIVLEYVNGEWITTTSPQLPSGATGGSLGAVSCVESWACVAEGSVTVSTGTTTYFSEAVLSAPNLPSAVISSPNANQVYSLGQNVPTSFSCFEGTGGPGIASCTDSNSSTSPGVLNTSTYGEHSYSVVATSGDGLTATASITYWVAAPPTATIASPASDPTYIMNQSASSSFACADGSGGPGIQSCVDSSGSTSPGQLNTSNPGPNTYSVTATSADGLTTTTSAGYNVIGPPTVTVNAPTQAKYYGLGQTVVVDPDCLEYPGGPGLASCDSNGSPATGVLDTSTIGAHTYTVTATSLDGLTATSSYTYTVAGLPTATITSPASGGTYTVGQAVPTTFTCSEGAGGTGLNSCMGSINQTSPGLLNTGSSGLHTFTVDAASNDGLVGVASITYLVADAPTASISSPASGGTYTLNQVVPTAFSCSEGYAGTGIATCLDSNNQGSPGVLNTSSLGTHTYSVNATSKDGLSGSASITYTVVPANAAPAVTLNPVSQTGYAGTTLTFTANASGYPAPTVQWQISTNKGSTWTNYTGAGATSSSVTSASLTTTESGWEVRAVFTNSSGKATTSAATITVLKDVAPKVTTPPASKTVAPGATATFSAAASGTPTPTVQWQVSTNSGSTWANVSGATSTTLNVAATTAENGWRYRAVFTNAGGSATSGSATLKVT